MHKILVVDDDEGVVRLVSRALSRDGFEVVTAANGRQALAAVESAHPDLVIMDICMPEMDGYAATALIKQKPGLSDLPVIYLSGRTAQEDGGRAFASGGTLFMRKPFNINSLLDIVRLSLNTP